MTAEENSLLAAWAEVQAHAATAAAVFDTAGGVQRTFRDIETEAVEIAGGALGEVASGSVVGIQLGNHPSWPAVLLACWRCGLVALPLERSISAPECEAALQVCHAASLFADDGNGSFTIARLTNDPVQWSRPVPGPQGAAASARRASNVSGAGARRLHPPVLLKLTSGTTAAPRAIRFRSAQLLADCEQICDTMGITAADLNFGVIPVSHSYGFSNLLTPLLARGVPLVMSRDRMPRAVLDDLARTGATVFPGMPVFYQAFCEMDPAPALPQVRLCISAGAPLSLPVARKFRERFGHAIHSFYGSSECGGICYDREALLEEQGLVGAPMEGVVVELLDREAQASRIRVRTAAAGDGYFPQPDEEKLGHGSFAADDLVSRFGDGFRIVGRVSDVINVAGKKVNPAEVEAALLAFAGVREAVVFGRASTLRNEEVAACIVAHPAVAEQHLLEFCRQRLSGWQVPKRLFFVEELPVNERGKLSRRALAERFAG